MSLRERYQQMAQAAWWKAAHEGRSLGEALRVEDAEAYRAHAAEDVALAEEGIAEYAALIEAEEQAMEAK